VGDPKAESMARMAALFARRGTTAAEVEKKVAELDAIDAEIRVEAAKLAGVPEAHPETANGVAHAHTMGSNGSSVTNGCEVATTLTPTPAAAPRAVAVRGQLAPRKMELLGFLRDKPEVGLANLAIRMYGNEGRSARVNVSTYTTELKADGYIDSGSRPGTFCLTEKGRAMCL
jgi:hypothetical protein